MRVYSLFLAAVTLGLTLNVLGQVETDEAQIALDKYCLYATKGLMDYYVEAAVQFETGPDSLLAIASDTDIRVFSHEGIRFESFECDATIVNLGSLDGGMVKRRDWGPFTKGSTATLLVGELVFEVTENGRYRPLRGTYDYMNQRKSMRRLPLLEWPVVTYQRLGIASKVASPLERLPKSYECVRARRKEKELIGTWTLKQAVNSTDILGAEITFNKDGLPVLSKWTNEHLGAGENIHWMSEVATKWETIREFSVPSKIDARLHTPIDGMSEVSIKVDFKWYYPGDEKYDAEKKRVDELVAKIQDADQPAPRK